VAAPTHVLFDFFGTLVDYSASRTEQGYHASHRLLTDLGADLDYERFLDEWTRVCADHDRRSDADDREYSMMDVGTAFLRDVLGREPRPGDVGAFAETYVGEWNTGVRYPSGITNLIDKLDQRYRLAVVTNTHHAPLVPRHLEAMGLRSAFAAVVTSVEVGWRKPHPRIYRAAFDALGIAAAEAVFVGDTYDADFLGPTRAGMRAYLIASAGASPVPSDHRLTSILELPERLGTTAVGR
jgi:putative hydrolase of the HAD superfamily